MKFTLSWLKEHLNTSATLEDILAKLDNIGLEVEAVENPAESLAPFKVAEILAAEPHPNADKLKVCKVNTGAETLQIVCGAPNARAGIKVVLARPGDYIPALDFTLKPTSIRGVESDGMMCSAKELNLGDDHDGILELAKDAPVGTSFVEYAKLDDAMIEIAITPNRQDCLGVAGIARDLAAAGLGTLCSKTPKEVTGKGAGSIAVTLKTKECPLFTGRLITGVKNGPSPKWLQDKLKAIGLKPISTLVDITNYVAYDRGQPLHVYDATKIKGDICVRAAKEGETFEALDEKTYTLTGGETVIADDAGVLGLGGIMGGTTSGCQEDTTSVFVEAAWFETISTALAGRKHGIESDARYRFERGVDPHFTKAAMELASTLIIDLCGGKAHDAVVVGTAPNVQKTISFNPERVMTLGGLDLPATKSIEILKGLGFDVKGSAPYAVTAPSWRRDVEGEADLVEEVLRIYGYDKVPSVPLPKNDQAASSILTLSGNRRRLAKRHLAASGMKEAITWSFMRDDWASLFGDIKTLIIDNPISSALNCMRPNILPNLIEAAGRNNDRGMRDVALFEVGPQYRDTSETGQDWVAAGIRTGKMGARHWRDTAKTVSVFDAKTDALETLKSIGAPVENLMVFAEGPSWYHPGRSGTLRLGPKNILASFGEIHPSILKTLGVDGPVVGFEIFIDAAPQSNKKSTSRGALKISNLQSVERDFAFVVSAKTKAQDLIKAIKSADKTYIKEVVVFDVYEGDKLENGMKSLAVSLTLTPLTSTFTDDEIEAISNKVITAAEKAVGATLRG